MKSFPGALSFRKLSFRWKLTLWYSGIVAAALLLFSWLLYVSAKQAMYGNLDISLKQDAEYIHRTLQEKNTAHQPLPKLKRRTQRKLKEKFAKSNVKIGPPPMPELQPEDSTVVETPEEKQAEEVWADVYRADLLNPKANYVQVKNPAGEIVYRSENVDTLSYPQLPEGIAVTEIPYEGKRLRTAILRANDMDIVVGYPLANIQTILNELFATLLYLLPAVLVASIGGGWLLARASLRPINHIVETAKDITAHNMERRIPEPGAEDEMRRLVQTLNEMIDRLQQSFEQVRQFSADVSHELRTPLTILTGELELALRAERTTKEYQKTVSSALDEALRLSQIVNKLLTLSRAEAGQLEIQHEKVHLKELLEDIVEDAEILASSKKIEVTFDSEADAIVNGDAPRMHELFLNLIDNAIKYSSIGASLHVALARENGQATVRISDTGIGIPESDLPKIFDRFYRVDKARSRAIGGSGLGLSISKWIVEAHDGTINVTSEVGKGTEFVVSLPIAADS